MKNKTIINHIKVKIEKAEKSGFTNDSKEEILKQSKVLLNKNKFIK